MLLAAAQVVQPGFQADTDRLTELSDRLDGMPLALEEVGRRLPVLGMERLLDQVRDAGLDPLSARRLRMLLQTCVDHLPGAVASALITLTVVRGPVEPEAVASLLGCSVEGALVQLEHLVQAGWLAGDANGRLRFKAPVRAALAQPPSAALRHRHATWFAAQVRALLPGARADDPARVWDQARAIREDVRLATATAMSGGVSTEDLVTLLEGLRIFRFAPPGGVVDDDRLDAVLDAASPHTRVRGQLALGFMCLGVGRLDAAERRFSFARASPDPLLSGRAFIGQAAVHAHRHEVAEALAQYDRADAVLGPTGHLATIGRARAWRGLVLIDHDALLEGIDCLTEAIRILDRAGDPIGVAIHECNLGLALHRVDRLDEAQRLMERALARGRASGADWWLHPMIANLGSILQSRGDLAGAEALFAETEARLTPTADPRIRYSIALGHGTTAEGLAEHARARAHYELARKLGWRMDDAFRIALADAHLGALSAQTGELAEANASFAQAAAFQTTGVRKAALDVLRTHNDLIGWRDAFARGDVSGATVITKAARGVVRANTGFARRSVMVRRARFLLERACDQADARIGAAASEEAPTEGQLVLEPGAVGLWLPDGRFVDLRRRRLGRRLLTALFDARTSQPGVALDMDAVWTAGWGEDRASETARRNRIYVAVASLRSLGLKHILQSTSDGYRIDPDIPVLVREAE